MYYYTYLFQILFLHVFETYYDSFNFQVSTWNIEYDFSLASFYKYVFHIKT